MSTIKTEGFNAPGSHHSRPLVHRPFSDRSMTVDTDFLASLTQPSHHHLPMASPFVMPQSLPEHYMTPNIGFTSPHTASFHPAALFNEFQFGLDNPEPPINILSSSLPDQRARSHSANRNSVGRAPARARSGRKLSMNDARPPSAGILPRGRSAQPLRPTMSNHQRTMSQSDASFGRMGLGIGLDTHQEDEKTDSISPPDYGLNGVYGTAVPRGLDVGSWGSVPSLIPGSMGSYMQEEVLVDSPITPAQPLPHLHLDDSYKKQRRRECHNQVEKRRREHINTKIEELSQLLPASYAQLDEAIDDEEEEEENPIASPIKKKKGKRSGSTVKPPKDGVQCKGRVLTHSVNYIHDLKQFTDLQAARIQHLESLLGFQAQSGSWQNGSTPFNSFEHQVLPPEQLEMMRPSPEPENRAFNNAFYNPFSQDTTGTAFEASPAGISSGSGTNEYRRSSSLSGSASFDGNGSGSGPSPMDEDARGRQMDRPARKESSADIQMGVSGIDLDAMFGNVRREDDGGMRW